MSLSRWMLEPESWWEGIARQLDAAPAAALNRALATIVIGALVMASAAELGARVFNVNWSSALGVMTRPDGFLSPFAFTFAGALLWPLLLAALMAALMPMFGRPRRWAPALLVAVHGAAPLYVTSVALIVYAGTLLFVIAFVISGFWWTAGTRRLLGVATREAAEFVAVTVLGAIILSQFVGAMLSGLLS